MHDRSPLTATADTGRSAALPTGQVSDELLIRRYVCDGDEQAFVRLITRHRARIRRLLFGLLQGNRDDIQDVEQDVLMALCRDLCKFRYDSSFETYLYRFAHNRAIDYIRSQRKQRRIVEELGARSTTAGDTYAEHHLQRERKAAVAAILSHLSEEERLLITLKELEGLHIEEIARTMRLPVGTVKSRLHRTRRKIAKLAGGESE